MITQSAERGGKEVMWAFTVMSTFFPLYYHLFNIAEIADDTSASWPVSVIVSVFSSAHCKNLGPLGLRSPCLSLSCCPCRPHSPLDSGIRPQPLLSPPLPSTLPSPTDPLAESVGAICGGEATFSLPGCYFSLHWFFFFLNINTKHGLTYAILVSLTGSLSYCFTSPVYTTVHMDHGSTLLQEE